MFSALIPGVDIMEKARGYKGIPTKRKIAFYALARPTD